jgi:hypothetical protein
MLTIMTKRIAPTNTKGARIKATIHSPIFRGGSKSVTIPLDYSLSHIKCHNEAAKAALEAFNKAYDGSPYPPYTIKDLSLGMMHSSDCIYVLTSNHAEI